MTTIIDARARFAPHTLDEFISGEVVAPGVYVDVESGATVEVREADTLPEGRQLVSYTRRFRKLEQREPGDARRLAASAA